MDDYAKLRKEGKPEHLLFLSAPREHKASGGEAEILCCIISNPSLLHPLPIISSVLLPAQQDRNEEVTIMVEEDTGTKKKHTGERSPYKRKH